MSEQTQPSPRSSRRIVWLLLLAGLLILLIWLGMKAWRSYQAAQSLMARQAEAETLLADGLTNMDPASAEALVYGLREDVVTLRDELGFLLPVAPLFGFLPQVGPLLAHAPAYMEMADAGTEAAAYGFRGMQPALAVLQDETATNRIPLIVQVLATAQPDLAQASQGVERVAAARAEIDNVEELPWRVQQLLIQADTWLPIGRDGLKLALVAPELLGANGPRSYVVLAQNEDEARPTGGFISGAGLIVLENGNIVSLDFKDASLINDVTTKPYDEYPPDPLRTYMLLDYFLLRDSNFWPDFPTSAQKGMELYAYGEDIPTPDGVIGIDQQFMQALVQATGPITLETGQTVNANNIISSLQNAWTLDDGVLERKSFLTTFADAIRQRIEQDPASVDPKTLAESMFGAAAAKDLQIYATNPEVTAVLDEIGWSGKITPPTADTLMVIDTSIGYNKANAFVKREVAYSVDLSAEPRATVSITHIHTGTPDGEPCFQGTYDEYVNKEGYDSLTNKCYWNYMRTYVPEGSTLISGTTHSIPGNTWFSGIDLTSTSDVLIEQPGYTTFANFMLLDKGSQINTTYVYNLPPYIKADNRYSLLVQKQAGVQPHPLTVSITLPAGATLITTSPEASAVANSIVTFTTELAQDTEFTISYR